MKLAWSRSAPWIIALVSGACDLSSDDQGPPPPIEIADGTTHVRIELDPFRVSLYDGARLALASLQGDGVAEATHDEPGDVTKPIPGWDGYEAIEDPWSRSGVATVISKTTSSARLS